MNREYSIKVHDNIIANTEAWVEQFEESTYFKKLTKAQKSDAQFIIELFTDWSYGYELRRPREWTQNSLYSVLLDPFPRKITAESAFFKRVEPVLTQYFLFLEELGKIKNSKALIKTLKEVAPEMVAREKDPAGWGFAKQLMSSSDLSDFDLDIDYLNL
ncbi:hypothetical protein IGI37_002644 [Enterococcus sp. AZ194]|uniref:hypothetical protein n=1 Tax=Enterococcus sp. AZ194 TaxID=2774629 RepID=UPI003F20DE5F